MNLALWIVQGLLAFAFIALGGFKLFAHEKFNAYTEKGGSAGIPPGLVTFTGIAELAGGFGIVLPWRSAWHRLYVRGPRSDSRP
jgi:uncharacterized membrane protein YphA (DoxX/SURF4 family)